jgi:hypothetical protein
MRNGRGKSAQELDGLEDDIGLAGVVGLSQFEPHLTLWSQR